MKKAFACIFAAGMVIETLSQTSLLPVSAKPAMVANPIISRNVPAYSGTNPVTASAGNDEYYYSF